MWIERIRMYRTAINILLLAILGFASTDSNLGNQNSKSKEIEITAEFVKTEGTKTISTITGPHRSIGYNRFNIISPLRFKDRKVVISAEIPHLLPLKKGEKIRFLTLEDKVLANEPDKVINLTIDDVKLESSNNSDDLKSTIDSVYNEVTKKIIGFKCDSINLNEYNFSTDGGMLYKYSKDNIVLLRTILYGESGSGENSYLLIDSTLSLIEAVRNHYNVPYYVENEFDPQKTQRFFWKFYIKDGELLGSKTNKKDDNYGNTFESHKENLNEYFQILKGKK